MTEGSPVRRVAVRGDDGLAGELADALADAGVSVVTEEAEPSNGDALVTVGEAAFLEAAAAEPATPILPVGVGEGHHALSRRSLGAGATALASGDYRVADHSLLDVTVAGESVGRAVMDVTLMTTEPAKISEYALHEGAERLDAVRADGVVAATPIGSSGYARAAGGAVLAPGAGVTVVPVAPFATRSDAWVFEDGLVLTVVRDESDVSLYLDDRRAGTVEAHSPVEISPAGGFRTLRVPDIGRE